MYQKKAPVRPRHTDSSPADENLAGRIDALRLELAELEDRYSLEVSGPANATRPDKKTGTLTVHELVDLGIILEESIRRGRELKQIEQAKLLGEKNSKALNGRLERLEKRIDEKLYRTKEQNRSGEMTFEGWEFAMIGILLRQLVILEEALPRHKFEYILRRLVWSLRSESVWAFETHDPDERPITGLGLINAGIRGFHWLDVIFPVDADPKLPLDRGPKHTFQKPTAD